MKKIAICIILAAVIVIAAVCVGFLLIRADNEKSGDPLTYALEAYSPIYTENGLLLELSEDGSFYSVVGQGKCTDEHIVIPSAYNKKPIKAINSGAFYYHKELKTLSIPDSVTYVGTAFPESLEYNVIGSLRYLGNEKNP